MHGPDRRDAGRRGLIALVTAVAALVAMTVMVGASWSATGSSSASQYQYGTKVTICHHTHSKKHPLVTIRIAQAAVKAHLKHGDTVGACTTPTTTAKPAAAPTTSTSSTGGSSTNGHGQGQGNSGSHGRGHGH